MRRLDRERAVVRLALGMIALLCIAGCTTKAVPSGETQTNPACPAARPSAPTPARHINLVLDDSSSMFATNNTGDPGSLRDRWSVAKYSLEVFAAMLGEGDTLHVYLMSDFSKGRTAGPKVELTGAETATDRVTKIHEMQLVGGKTPFTPAERAYEDIKSVDSDNKWLVILTDGEFDNVDSAEVNKRLHGYTKENRELSVNLIAFGDKTVTIPNRPEDRVYFDSAKDSGALMRQMTDISNRVFQRKKLEVNTGGGIAPDINLAEALVFAQGTDARIGDIHQNAGGTIAPSSVVDVSWTKNDDARYGDKLVPAKPNEFLKGKLAAFVNVPAGAARINVNPPTVDVFYKPQVNFGIKLTDVKTGHPVELDEIDEGDYKLEYGFVNDKCEFVNSDLLGDVTKSATIVRGQDVAEVTSGDVVTIDRGDIKLELEATYLDGYKAEAQYPVKVTTWQERLMTWLQTVGWQVALWLLALITALGYVFKRRFPKAIKPKPTTTFRSKQFGQRPHEGRGKFTVANSRKFLPFFADKATLRYWDAGSGVFGLKALKLKAGPRGTMTVENWKQLTKAGNVSINGLPINEDTKREPTLSAGSVISGETSTGTVEMTPGA